MVRPLAGEDPGFSQPLMILRQADPPLAIGISGPGGAIQRVQRLTVVNPEQSPTTHLLMGIARIAD